MALRSTSDVIDQLQDKLEAERKKNLVLLQELVNPRRELKELGQARVELARCRFRFQSGTGGVREIKALRELSPAAFSVSIETGSTFFRFQLGLVYLSLSET